MAPHRNSPAVENDGNVPSHSPTPQTGSPSKRPRLSPSEGSFQAGQVNGQLPQNLAGQQVMVNSNGVQFNPQFNAGMVQVKPNMGGIPQQQFHAMTPQQRQAMMNMVPGKIPGQPVVTPGGTQMPANSPMGDGQAVAMDGAYRQPNNQRLPQNVNALQDYQNQLMLLERVNQQRLSESGSGNGQAAGNNPSQLAAGGEQGQFKPGAQGRAANAGQNPAKSGQSVSPLTDMHGQPQGNQQQAGPHRTSPPMGANFNGQVMQGPNGAMMPAGGPHGMWPGQPQGQSPHIQQRRSPSQSMNQAPPGQSPVANLNQQSPVALMNQPNSQQMPPPNGPISTTMGNKTQPSSPTLANPPTPTKTHKQIPKNKKEAREASPKRRGKKGNPATPIASSEPPTPTTPATPHAPSQLNGTSAPNPVNVMASANTPNSSASKVSNSTSTSTPNDKDDAHKNDLEMSDAVFNQHGGPVNGQMRMSTGSDGLSLTSGQVNPGMVPGGVLDDQSFLHDFGSNEGDVTDMDFDFNTFLNEDGTSNGLGFDGASTFNWGEGVETGNDM